MLKNATPVDMNVFSYFIQPSHHHSPHILTPASLISIPLVTHSYQTVFSSAERKCLGVGVWWWEYYIHLTHRLIWFFISFHLDWCETGSISHARYSYTLSVLADEKVLVISGFDYYHLNSTELYDFSMATWKTTGSMNYSLYDHTVSVFINGQVLVTGGQNNAYSGLST